MKDNVTINIYGGNNQVIPDVKEVEQHIYTEDGKVEIINKFKVKWFFLSKYYEYMIKSMYLCITIKLIWYDGYIVNN